MSSSTAQQPSSSNTAQQPSSPDENEEVLCEALTRWVNWNLESHNLLPIADLIEGVKDGRVLLQLVECISGQPLTPERGTTRIHCVGNVNKLLDFLRLQSTLKIQNIVPEDIIDGNAKIILSLVWNIALYYQIVRVLVLDGLVTRDSQLSACEQAILSWCQQCTENYSTVDITNLTSSWRDGLALNAVLHSHLSATFDFSRVLRMSPAERVNNALELASNHLGIQPIFGPDAIVSTNQGLDKKTLLLYLSMLFERLPRLPAVGGLIHRSDSHSPTDIQSSGYEKQSMTSSMTDNDGGASGGLGSSMGGPAITFAESLESMLSWLAVAEGQLTLAESEPFGEGTPALVEQLSQHEELMGDMAKQQTTVGQLLLDGSQPPSSDSDLQLFEAQQKQVILLRQRWEDLRTRVIARLGAIQDRLRKVRRSDLDRISHALPQLENAIRDQLDSVNGRDVLAVVNSLEGLNTHVNLIHNFEASVEGYLRTTEAVHANLIACEETEEFGNDGPQLLQKAVSFGERLASLQRQLEQQRDVVDRALRAWRFFAEEESLFNSWLAEKEALMERMVATKLNTSITGQSGTSSSGSGSPLPFAQTVIRQVRMLKSIELEMDSQVRRFDSLNDHAQLVVASLGGNTAVLATVSRQLEAMQQRWESLVGSMESHSQTLAATGVDLSEALLPSPSDSQEMQRSVGGGGSSGGSSNAGGPTVGTGLAPSGSGNIPTGNPASISPASSCLSEFEFAARQLIEWLERAESGVGLMAVGDTRHPMSTEEQLSLLGEMRGELTSQINQLDSVKQLGTRLVQDLEQAGESGVDVTEAVRSLENRLERLSQTANASERRLLVGIDVRVIQEEISSLNEVLAGYEKFLKQLSTDRPTDPSMSSNLIDQCRVKLKLMSSYGDRIESLEHRSSALQAPEDSMLEEVSHLHEEVDRFVGKWNKTRGQIDEHLKILKTAAAQRPPKSVVESINALSKWLAEVEGVLQSERIEANEVPILEEQLNQLKELSNAVREYEDYLSRVESGVRSNAGAGSQEQASLQASVTKLVEQYATVRETIVGHSTQLQRLIGDLTELQSNCDGLNTWLDEMRGYITETRPAIGDPETLKQQVTEWNDAERDVSTLEQTLSVIQSLTNRLLACANSPNFADKLVKQLSTLQSRFSDTAGETRGLGASLKSSLETVEDLWARADGVTEWLEERSNAIIAENGDRPSNGLPIGPIVDEAALQERLQLANVLRQEFEGKSAEYAALQQNYDQLVPSGASTLDTPLNKRFQKLNAAWDRLGGLLANRLAELQRAQTEIQSVKDLARQEGEWLNEVEQRLTHCRRPLTDAEDISEQSYELENVWQRDAAANVSTELRAVSDRLLAAETCSELVSELRKQADTRKDVVGERVTEELARLESMLQQSQEIERTLLGVMQWLCDADELLQSRLENDILAADVPQEFEALQNEFAEHERVCARLEGIKETLTTENRELAAARLNQQLELIRERFAAVNHKFAKFQRPADFETKLDRVRRVLEDVEDRLNLLEIREADVETLSSQLDHCLRFYRTLSEVKPEVEYVLRTGRQVVERRQVDFPEKLSATLDAIKHRFNAQGSQVTQSKGMLERAAKLAKKLTKDANVLRDLYVKVDAAVADVQQNDEVNVPGCPPAMSVEDGLRLLEVLEGQLRRRQQTLRSADDCMSQLSELAGLCCNGGETAQQAMKDWLQTRHGALQTRMDRAVNELNVAIGKLREKQHVILNIQANIQSAMESIGSALFRAEAQLRRWTTTGELVASDRQKLQTLQGELETTVAGSLFSQIRSLASQLGDIDPRLQNAVDAQTLDFGAKLSDVQTRIQMALTQAEVSEQDSAKENPPLQKESSTTSADDVVAALQGCLEKVLTLHQPDLSATLSSDAADQLVKAYSSNFEATDEAVRACIARIGVWLEETSQGEEAERVAVMLEDLKKQASTLVDHHASVTRLSRGVSDLREMELLRDQLSERLAKIFDAADSSGAGGISGVTQEDLDVVQTEAGDLQTILNRVAASGFQPDSAAVRLLRRCDDLLSLSTSGLLLQSQIQTASASSVTGTKDDVMFLSALSVQTTSKSVVFDTPHGGSVDIMGDEGASTFPMAHEVSALESAVDDVSERVSTIQKSLAKADHVATVVLLENEFSSTLKNQMLNVEAQCSELIESCHQEDSAQLETEEKLLHSVESLREQTQRLKRSFDERKADIQLVDQLEDRVEAVLRDVDAIMTRRLKSPKPQLFAQAPSLFGLALYGLDAELSACLSEFNLSESSSVDSPLASRALQLRNRIQAGLERLRSQPDAPKTLNKADIEKCLQEGEEMGDNEWYASAGLVLKWAQQSPIASDEIQQIQQITLALADERAAFAKQVDAWVDRILPEVTGPDGGVVDISALLSEIERKKRRLSIIADLDKAEELRQKLDNLRQAVVSSAGLDVLRWLGVIHELVAAGRVRLGDKEQVAAELEKLTKLGADFDEKQTIFRQIVDDSSSDDIAIQMNDLKKQWDAAVVAVEERKTQLVGILALGNEINEQSEKLDNLTGRLLDSTSDAKAKALEPTLPGIVTPPSSTRHTESMTSSSMRPSSGELAVSMLSVTTSPPSSMPSPSISATGSAAAASEIEASKESVETASRMAERLSDKGNEAELLAKATGDDASMVRDRIDKSLRKFGTLVNRRLSLASIAQSAGKKTLDEQVSETADWISAAESRLNSLQRSFDAQISAISSASIVPAEGLAQQLQDLLRESANQTCQMEALQKQHPDLNAVHALRDRMNRLQTNGKELGDKLTEPTWQRIAAALKLQTTWASSTHATIIADFSQLPSASDKLSRLRARLQELRREIEVKRPVVDRLISNGHSALVNADSSAINELGKTLRTSREKWDQLLTAATRAEQRLTTATPLIGELETCTRLASEKLEKAERESSTWVSPSDLPVDSLDAELERVRSLELALLPIQSRLDCLEQLCDRLNQIDAPLEATARSFVEALRSRWRNLHSATAQRHADLHRLLSEFGPHHFLAASVEPPWERALTQPGRIPYYVNHQAETTSWDHPAMQVLIDSFRELNNIRFAAYRTGQKLRAVQRGTCLDQIPLLDFSRCCDKLGFPTTSQQHNALSVSMGPMSPPNPATFGDLSNAPSIDILDMVTCLSQVFESAAEQYINTTPMNVPLCVDLTLNWLLNCYDPARTGRIRQSAFKTGVALLAGGTLEEKYRYLFRVYADASGRCDARRLALLIHDALQLPRHLGEVAAFGGTNVEPSVRSCLALAEQELEKSGRASKSPSSPRPANKSGHDTSATSQHNGTMNTSTVSVGGGTNVHSLFITVDTFLEWLQLEPQSFVWLPVLYRLALSETAEHPGVRCAICKSNRLLGLRYRCLRCFSFDICQTCFFSGRVAKSHKLTHPIQEYCTTTTSSEEVRDLTTVFCNQFRPRSYFKKHRRYGYLPVQTVYEGTPIEGPAPSSVARHSHPPPRIFDDCEPDQQHQTNEISYAENNQNTPQQVVPQQQQQRADVSFSSPSPPEKTSTPLLDNQSQMPVPSSTVAQPPTSASDSKSMLNDSFQNSRPNQSQQSYVVQSDSEQVMSVDNSGDDEHLLIARYARVLESGQPQQQQVGNFRRPSGNMVSSTTTAISYETTTRRQSDLATPSSGDLSTSAMDGGSPSHTSQATVVTVVRHQQQQNSVVPQQPPQPQSPMQILASMEANKLRDDVENRIRQLEGESARLQQEYSRLLTQQRQVANGSSRHSVTGVSHEQLNDSNNSNGMQTDSANNIQNYMQQSQKPLSEAEMASEARMLRHHRDRLELRLRILEEHNGQLENQLARLRLLLADHNNRSGQPPITQSQHVVPSASNMMMEASSSTLPLFPAHMTAGRTMSQPVVGPPPAYTATGTYRRTGAAANMSELLQMADSIGQAVGTLVTVLTDSESDTPGNTA